MVGSCSFKSNYHPDFCITALYILQNILAGNIHLRRLCIHLHWGHPRTGKDIDFTQSSRCMTKVSWTWKSEWMGCNIIIFQGLPGDGSKLLLGPWGEGLWTQHQIWAPGAARREDADLQWGPKDQWHKAVQYRRVKPKISVWLKWFPGAWVQHSLFILTLALFGLN